MRRRNAIRENPALAAELFSRVKTHRAGAVKVAEDVLTPEVSKKFEEHLRLMGYIE